MLCVPGKRVRARDKARYSIKSTGSTRKKNPFSLSLSSIARRPNLNSFISFILCLLDQIISVCVYAVCYDAQIDILWSILYTV